MISEHTLNKDAGFLPTKASIPRSSISGMNTKLLGRVAPVEPVKDTMRAAIQKTAAERTPVERKEAPKEGTDKTAASIGSLIGSDAGRSFASNIAGGLGAVAAVGAANAISGAIGSIRLNMQVKNALNKAISINPRLQQKPRAELEGYVDLIAEASPSVARNPLLLANYLEFLIDHQGQLNYQAYDRLVNLEGSILSNHSNANPLTGQVQKAIIETSIRGAFDAQRDVHKENLRAASGGNNHGRV